MLHNNNNVTDNCVTICLYFVICSGFEAPSPEYQLVADNISNFIAEVHRSLKLGVYVHCSLKVKSSVPPTGRGNFFDLADFSNVYFPHDWYVVYDKLGNGCKVGFPVRLESNKLLRLDGTVGAHPLFGFLMEVNT